MNLERFSKGLGLRSIKTTLSVFLCIPLLRLVGLDQPFFACIAAVVGTQATVKQSFKVGMERIVGTMVGAAWGLFFVLLSPPPVDPVDLSPVNMALIGLGTLLVIYSVNVLQMPNAANIAPIVFIGIMINLLPGRTPLETAGLRTIETILGIVIAALVNWLIFPYREPEPDEGERK